MNCHELQMMLRLLLLSVGNSSWFSWLIINYAIVTVWELTIITNNNYAKMLTYEMLVVS